MLAWNILVYKYAPGLAPFDYEVQLSALEECTSFTWLELLICIVLTFQGHCKSIARAKLPCTWTGWRDLQLQKFAASPARSVSSVQSSVMVPSTPGSDAGSRDPVGSQTPKGLRSRYQVRFAKDRRILIGKGEAWLRKVRIHLRAYLFCTYCTITLWLFRCRKSQCA